MKYNVNIGIKNIIGNKGWIDMSMRITNQNRMTEAQERAHMHMPCPVCGKLNTPYSYMDGLLLPSRSKYFYKCMNTSIQKWEGDNDKLLGFETVKGCECEWEITLNNKKEFLQTNNHLTDEQVHELTKFIGNDDIMLREEIRQIQTLYWNNHETVKGNICFKKKMKKCYVKFLKAVVRLCNK